MEKLLWNRCFICSSELEPEVAVAEKDSDGITQSQTKLGSNPKTIVKENQASPATKSCRNQRQNESPPEKAHSSFSSDSPEDERQQDFKLEPEDQYEDESSLYSSDEDQSDPTPAADKAPPKPRGPADKSHEDILLHYLLTYCQQNRIIGKLLFDDIKKLRSASSNYDGVHHGSPTLNRKCVISIQFCKSCDHLAKNLKHLHSQLEVLQINIINQLKIVKQAVINNSRQYGCKNEGMKSDFNKFEQWLNQKGTLPEDWDTGRKFLQVFQQFQTTVFESSTRMCDMQLELLLKFMGNSRVPPPPPVVYKKRKPEKAFETEEQEVTDFDSNSEDEEEVSFVPDLLQTDFDVTEDPLNLKASETKSDHKLMTERRKNRLVHKLNPQRRKNTRTVLAERIKKLKMMLQKKPFTKAIVQQSGEYRVTINQHSPSSPPQSPNENVKVIEFESYKPGYKVEVIKKVKSHKVTTIADAPFLARKFRREWTDRRKEKKLKRKGQMLCEICPYTTVGASRFEQHLREHETLEKKRKCPVCSKRFTTKQYYELHLIYYCGVELWRCDACKIAVNRKRISEHLKKMHEGSKVYNCQHCDLFYVNFSNLATHSLCHPGGFQSLKCQLCPPDSEAVLFTTKRSVLRHLVEEHDQTQLLIKCDYANCYATYFFMGDLWAHKQTHLYISSLRCSTCDRTFSSNSGLQRHIKSRHLKEKIFACSECSEKFTTMGRREKHLLKEHAIANYKCDLCNNEVFRDSGSLR
ncbi:unnamed protein product [Orchesella dallaii]|uniref:C2H2-type domain-containing protein n=1 Tax=Orchesella dallaii TaxID=48710 RepID=A0ABP1PWE8_9HEXA